MRSRQKGDELADGTFIKKRKENTYIMDPIITLFEREAVAPNTLPPLLATLYGGGLHIPKGQDNHPYVYANFVETIDGIVSYNAPDQLGGGLISGDKEQDKMVMGLLRAHADAVIFGSSSLIADANHPRTPAYIYPALASEYEKLRAQLGKTEPLPISVVMTTNGKIDLRDRSFSVPGLRAIIMTTTKGRNLLLLQHVPSSIEIRVVEPPASSEDESNNNISPQSVLALLANDYGVRTVLYEGGPTLLASFLAEHLINELFLTFSPQIAGRATDRYRLSLVESHAFLPKEAPWATLMSVKLAGSHLLLRYKL